MNLTVLLPRVAPRAQARVRTWWGKAWARALEEAAYDDGDLKAARAIARAGRVGSIEARPGRLRAAVEDASGLWSVEVEVPVLEDAALDALVETVAAESGRVSALLAGDLPHDLVEHAEEAGVELLPYGGELSASCSCPAWVDACPHALAVLTQVGWLLDDDPFVLLHLRGLPRDLLLARLHARAPAPPPGSAPGSDAGSDADDPDLEHAVDAAVRARRLLELLDQPGDPALDHLL